MSWPSAITSSRATDLTCSNSALSRFPRFQRENPRSAAGMAISASSTTGKPPPSPDPLPPPLELPAPARALPTRRTKSSSTAAVPLERWASSASEARRPASPGGSTPFVDPARKLSPTTAPYVPGWSTVRAI